MQKIFFITGIFVSFFQLSQSANSILISAPATGKEQLEIEYNICLGFQKKWFAQSTQYRSHANIRSGNHPINLATTESYKNNAQITFGLYDFYKLYNTCILKPQMDFLTNLNEKTNRSAQHAHTQFSVKQETIISIITTCIEKMPKEPIPSSTAPQKSLELSKKEMENELRNIRMLARAALDSFKYVPDGITEQILKNTKPTLRRTKSCEALVR